MRDVVVENNHIEHAEKGVWIRDDAAGVLLRGNTTRDVGLPVVTREVLQRIRAEQLAKLSVQKQPIAHWSFDQVTGTAVFDQSPNRFTARVEGAVEFSPEGVRGQCAVFDGTGHLRVEGGNRLRLQTWTIAAWIKPATVEGRSGIIAKRTANVAAPFVLGVRDGRLTFEGCSDENQWTFNFASDVQIHPDRWQHVAAVIEQGKGVTLYIDGKSVARKLVAERLIQTDQDLWIGCDAWGGRPADVKTRGYFLGALDEVKIWSRALSKTDLQTECLDPAETSWK
ncbi:MAG: LamG domain-containing protein [Pirellulaceae bacterium]